MPRRAKPPGFEKWTWEEIRAGRKISKGEKRGRRLAKSFGAREGEGGKIEHTPESFFAVLMVVLLLAGIALLAECGAA